MSNCWIKNHFIYFQTALTRHFLASATQRATVTGMNKHPLWIIINEWGKKSAISSSTACKKLIYGRYSGKKAQVILSIVIHSMYSFGHISWVMDQKLCHRTISHRKNRKKPKKLEKNEIMKLLNVCPQWKALLERSDCKAAAYSMYR